MYPERIGIVTSGTGAALQDILNIIRRRHPGLCVLVNPVRVQGFGASEDIARAIDEFNAYGDIDVMIVGRGGGSLEDLWAFNEESVARAIARSRIPIVSAVGHEIDFTIADFVADLRAPTPSAAAELVVRDRREILDIVRNSWYTMHDSMRSRLRREKEAIGHLLRSYSFNRPIDLLRQLSQRSDELTKSMSMLSSHSLALTAARIDGLQHRLLSLDPSVVLKRGYAIVTLQGRVVASAAVVKAGDDVDIRFQDGTVSSTIH